MMETGEQPGTPPDAYVLHLYVAGTTPRSLRALEAVRKVCDGPLAGRCELVITDIYKNPEAARRDQIIAVPTLVKRAPEPARILIGDLADQRKLLERLDVQT